MTAPPPPPHIPTGSPPDTAPAGRPDSTPQPSPTAPLPADADRAALAGRLRALYPVLDSLPAPWLDEALAHEARHLHLPAGLPLFSEGQPCQGFPLVLAGEVRVTRGSPQGRALGLYRAGPGELCVASTASLFGHGALMAHGATALPTELVVLSPAAFERWTAVAAVRRFAFGTFADRLADLMALTEAVAFQRLDQRLAGALLGHGAVVQRTQQALADELGTVREIVSRLLKRFERAGWITLGRERITLLDAGALRQLAAGGPLSAATTGTPTPAPPAG